MSPGRLLLQQLASELRARGERIRRSSYAERVEIRVRPQGLHVEVFWKNKSGEDASWEKLFSLQELLGDSFHLDPLAWQVEKRPCGLSREIAQAVLYQRGVM